MSYKIIGFGKRVVLILSFVLLLVDAGAVFADVKLPAVISGNMVLQRGMEVPIWGCPGRFSKSLVPFYVP